MSHLTRSRRRGVASIAGILAGAAGLMVATAGPASAHEGTEPIPVPSGNPNCEDIRLEFAPEEEWDEFKIEDFPAENGEYDYTLSDRGTPGDDSDDAIFTLDVFDKKRFNWSANVGIDAIFVKGGQGAGGSYLYFFTDEDGNHIELTEDVDYTVPPWGQWQKNDISHITICWDDEDKPDDTTTTSSTTTSTTVEDTTTTSAPMDTTTTTAEETTTTAAPTTETTAPSTSMVTDDDELPETGSNSTMMLVGIGTALLAVGAALVLGARHAWRRFV